MRGLGGAARRVATAGSPGHPGAPPGTRAALERAPASTLADDVRVIEPQGYRTSLALQLHAAAVLTDSGGVQREAAWLGVPCLILRGTTEWVEAGAAPAAGWWSSGSMRTRRRQLERLAPPERGRRAQRGAAADLGSLPGQAPRDRDRGRRLPTATPPDERVVMFVHNDVPRRPRPAEAGSLAEAGHDVTIVGTSGPGCRPSSSGTAGRLHDPAGPAAALEPLVALVPGPVAAVATDSPSRCGAGIAHGRPRLARDRWRFGVLGWNRAAAASRARPTSTTATT